MCRVYIYLMPTILIQIPEKLDLFASLLRQRVVSVLLMRPGLRTAEQGAVGNAAQRNVRVACAIAILPHAIPCRSSAGGYRARTAKTRVASWICEQGGSIWKRTVCWDLPKRKLSRSGALGGLSLPCLCCGPVLEEAHHTQ